MEIITEERGEILIVRIEGSIDMLALLELRELIKEAVAKKQNRVAVDMTHVPHVDSSGMGLLMNWAGTVEKVGGELRLFAAPAVLKKVMLNRMAIYNSEEEALRHF